MVKDGLEIRFGVIAVRKGYVTPEQFIDALEIQVMEDINGEKHRLIGKILSDEGLITDQQIRDVVDSIRLLRK